MRRTSIAGLLLFFVFVCMGQPRFTNVSLRELPLALEQNRSQSGGRFGFIARGSGYSLMLDCAGAVLNLSASGESGTALRLALRGAPGECEMQGEDRLPGTSNYILGIDEKNWRRDISRFREVRRRQVYPGIDMIFYGRQDRLEYDFIVAPDADPGQIRIELRGQTDIRRDAGGDLVIRLPHGEVRKKKPTIYQERQGSKVIIKGDYELRGRTISFHLGAYDHALPLIIDPILNYSTYLGGNNADVGQAIALDAAGNVYVAGYTASTNFPVSTAAFQSGNRGGQDIFVTKLNSTLSSVIYSTYIGGNNVDTARGIAVDPSGNAYLTGYTRSSDFPTTAGAIQRSLPPGVCGGGPCADAFVLKLNAAGNAPLYSTYLGGSSADVGYAIAIDSVGNAYVAGTTFSADFPTTAGVVQIKFGGGNCGGATPFPCSDAFVAKLNAEGTTLLYSTFLGGSDLDDAFGLALDVNGNAYVAGSTFSTNFPVTSGAFQTVHKGGNCGSTATPAACNDAFVAKLNAGATALVFATFLGGDGPDYAQQIAVNAAGNSYVVGSTGALNFPTTPGVYQTTYGGGDLDMFVSIVNATGTGLVASTLLGGPGTETASSIAVSKDGRVFVVGDSTSPGFLRAVAEKPDALEHARPAAGPHAEVTTLGGAVELDPDLLRAARLEFGIEDSDAAVAQNQNTICATGLGGPSSVLPGLSWASQPANAGSADAKVVCQSSGDSSTLPNAGIGISGSTNDPVNTANGESYDTADDLALGGPMRFRFTRYYSSVLERNGITSALGSNWMHNFDIRIRLSGLTASVALFRGRSVDFRQAAQGWQLAKPEPYQYQLVSTGQGFRFLDLPNQTVYTFSPSGSLTRIEDRNGNALTVTPSANGPASVSDGLGRSLTFTYTGANLTEVKDQADRRVSFSYTGTNLTTAVDANGGPTNYTYAAMGGLGGLLESKTLPAGNTRLTNSYDQQGRVAKQTDSLGNVLTIAYDLPSPGITTFTAPVTGSIQHTRSEQNSLTRYLDPNSQAVSFSYDSNGRRNSITDRDGDRTALSFDPASGLPTSYTDSLSRKTGFVYAPQVQDQLTFYNLSAINYPDGTSITMTYDNRGNILTLTDGAGKVWKYTHNQRGQVTSTIDPVGGANTFLYNPDATMASYANPAGDAFVFAYDNVKRVTSVNYANQTSRKFAYDNKNSPLSVTDERGDATTYTYDVNGNLTKLSDAAGAVTAFAYDTEDRIIACTDPLGKIATYAYDQAGRVQSLKAPNGDALAFGFDAHGWLTSLTNPAGKTASLTYDKEGVLTSMTDPLKRSWNFSSDALGRIVRETNPLGESMEYSYDSMGHIAAFKDALSRTATYRYDSRGLLASVALPEGIAASYARNDTGQISAITDPDGNTWKRSFDGVGRLATETDPLGRVKSYQYNFRDQVARATVPGGSMTFTYDSNGNPVKSLYSDGTELDLVFDQNNRVVSGEGLALAYNARGEVISSNGVNITRDDFGRIACITYGSQRDVCYTHNNQGLVSLVTDWLGGSMAFTYDDAEQLTSISRSNHVATNYSYDQNERVISIGDSGGNLNSSITLARDAIGYIISDNRNVPAAPQPATGASTFSYDAGGQVTGFTYDGLGRVVTDSRRSYSWDLASRLASFKEAGNTTQFSYDALGSIISSQSGSKQTYVQNYALGLPSPVIVREGESDRKYYVYLPNGALLYSIDAAGKHSFYHFDDAGNTLFLTDDSGAVTDTYGIAPYGEVVTHTGASDNPFTFAGAYGVMQLSTSGLYSMRFRWYDGATARFLSRDPLGPLGAREIVGYSYAQENPLANTDPFGLLYLEQAIDIAKIGQKGYKAFSKFDSKKPGNPEFVLATGSLALKAVEVVSKIEANTAFSTAGRIALSGPGGGMAVTEYVRGTQLLNVAKTAKYAGYAITFATGAVKEGNLASEEGEGTAGIIARGAVGGTADLAIGIANPVVAIGDGLTGGNFSQSIKQVYRAPEALLGGSKATRAYEKSVSTGKYGAVLKATNEAGTEWLDRGIGGMFSSLFGDSLDNTILGLGVALFGELPEPYTPAHPITPRKPPPRASSNKASADGRAK